MLLRLTHKPIHIRYFAAYIETRIISFMRMRMGCGVRVASTNAKQTNCEIYEEKCLPTENRLKEISSMLWRTVHNENVFFFSSHRTNRVHCRYLSRCLSPYRSSASKWCGFRIRCTRIRLDLGTLESRLLKKIPITHSTITLSKIQGENLC